MTDIGTFLVIFGLLMLGAAILAWIADTGVAWIDRREARRDWRAERDERRRQARERAWRAVDLIDPPFDYNTHDRGETA